MSVRSRRRPIWMDPPSVPVQVVKAIVLIIAVLVVIVPFLSILSTSLTSERDINAAGGGLVLLPTHLSFAAYQQVLAGGIVTRATAVSVGVTVIGTLASLAATSLLAYALSRRGTLLARPVLLLVLATLFFAPGIVPVYLMVRELGLLGRFASLVIPSLITTFNVVVLRAFFMGIPQELLDSARIDGAGELTVLLRIVLPLSKSVLAVIGLFYAVGYWNSWFNAVIYLNNTSMWPLQLVLQLYVLQGATPPPDSAAGQLTTAVPSESLQMAIVVIALIPILIVYPFLQRYFSKGVLTGAIKG